MSKRLIYASFILVTFTACYKRDESELNKPCTSGCAVFNVRVGTGENSATPVGGAHVGLVWLGPSDKLGGQPSIDVAKGYTDANGMFNIKFKAVGNEFTTGYFTLSATGPTNYFASTKPLFNIRKADTVLNTSIQLPLKAYVKVVMKNFDPASPDDSFVILPTFKDYGVSIIDASLASAPTGLLYHPAQSAAFDSVVYKAPTVGNQYTYFSIVIQRNGNRTSHLDSLYIPAGTLGTYRVDYQHSFQ
ncbi:MAG: hypothetical protein ACHQHN_05790 [Sphingobacteriales bacterium]